MSFIASSSKNPCPICGKKNTKCVFIKNEIAHCHYTRSEKLIPAGSGKNSGSVVDRWLHKLDSSCYPAKYQPSEPPALIEKLPEETVDQVFRKFGAHYPLTPKHKKYLQDAGVSDTTGILSFRVKGSSSVAKKLVASLGEEIPYRHPLFVLKDNKGSKFWGFTAWEDGILFPAWSFDGKILGYQLRKDNSQDKNDRYKWLGRDGLAGTPLTIFRSNSQVAIVTEGYKKAFVGHKHYSCNVIALAGINSWKENELLDALDLLKVARVAIALDNEENPATQRAEKRLLELIAKHRPKLNLEVMRWEGKKGLDDAILAGIEPTFELAEVKRPRFLNGLPIALLQEQHTTLTKFYSLKEARLKHREVIVDAIEKGKQIVITSTTGTGKTSAADEVAAQESKKGKRILLLAQNKDNILERMRPGSPLQKAGAVIQVGRQFNPEPEWKVFECKKLEAKETGIKRQVTTWNVCMDCEFRNPKTGWSCEKDGYRASRERSRRAELVIATKDAYLNRANYLAEFDVVICDEEIKPHLISTIEITRTDIALWQKQLSEQKDWIKKFDQWVKFFDVLDKVLSEMVKLGSEKAYNSAMLEIGQALEVACQNHQIISFDYFINWILPEPEDEKYKVYPFERPDKNDDEMPLRAVFDLLEGLRRGLVRARALNTKRTEYALVIGIYAENLVNQLKQKTLILLDSTPPPVLQEVFPNLEEAKFEVKQYIEVWQVITGNYSKRALHTHRTLKRVESQAKGFFQELGIKNALSIVPQRFEKELDLPGQKGHWGATERASNSFQHCDGLFLVGHHLAPIDVLKFELEVLRAYGLLEKSEKEGSTEKIRIYNWTSPKTGLTAGYRCKASLDTELQQAIEHSYSSSIIQAIGRLRGALRDPNQPAHVLIYSADPVVGLKVDHLFGEDEKKFELRLPHKNQNDINISISFPKNTPSRSSNFSFVTTSKTEARQNAVRAIFGEDCISEWWSEETGTLIPIYKPKVLALAG